jgi:hypothetical protein
LRPTIPQLRGGFPHSEIHGSTGARPSPRLIAACYVLPRLSVPRHPPNALKRLILANPKPAQWTTLESAKLAQLSSHLFNQQPAKTRPSSAPPRRRKSTPPKTTRGTRPAFSRSLHSLSTMTNSDQKTRNPELLAFWPSDFWPSHLVELNGIEPSTSCLQSRRSPN